jgi:DNA-binding SARP family transcriptional activator/predicted ATPase/Flp pilus assembly protein TadD
MLTIQLLSGLHIQLHNTPLHTFKSRKAEALLIYLAYNQRPYTREHLAQLLWPDSDPQQAAANLRKQLTDLRQHIAPYLLTDGPTISFDTAQPHQIDACTFRRLAPNPATAATAAALYQGDFLAGFTLRDSYPFEEWAILERERLHQTAVTLLTHLAATHLHNGQPHLGIPYANQLLALDNLNEAAHRLLMRLLAHSGQRNAALAHYTTCQQILQQELGVDPTPATTAVYHRLRHAPERPYHIPTHLPTLIGRHPERTQLSQLLDHPPTRLITLLGPGGIGKTSLARTLAPPLTSNYQHGITFAALATIQPPFLLSTLNTLLAIPTSKQPPRQQLLHHLQDKELLLILDSFEHLTSEKQLLTDILHHAPHVTLLVTSRHPLQLPNETILELQGLPLPTSPTPEAVAASPAAQLFIHHAQRTHPAFTLTPENSAAIAHICHLLDGLPLGLELAATAVRALTPDQIASQIQHNLDFLASPARDLPARHRSIRAIFTQSWAHPTPTEQTTHRRPPPILPHQPPPSPPGTPPKTLSIHLLGPAELLLGNTPLQHQLPRKAEALLMYILSQQRPIPRETLIPLFWDDSDPEQAAANLRKHLSQFRKLLGDYLLVERQTVALNTTLPHTLDTAEFSRLLATPQPTISDLQTAVTLYRAPFLHNLDLPDHPDYAAWLTLERERYKHLLSHALHTLIQHCLEQRQYPTGITYAHHLLTLNPLSEYAHRQLMLLHARSGNLPAAQDQYQQCTHLLHTELGVTPTPATTDLAARLQTAVTHPAHLPENTTSFIGRTTEQTAIHQQLNNPTCRLLTLLGPGGIGKTRLALQIAQERTTDYLHGVSFVSLTAATTPTAAISTLAHALGITLVGTSSPHDQIRSYLASREMLLILDNCETILAPAHDECTDFLASLLQDAPQLTLLATSRQRFNLHTEQIIPIGGLTPELSQRLFVERGRAARPGYALTPANQPHIQHICQLLDGSPLALELAAAALNRLSTAELAATLQHNLDILHNPHQPERHHSIRAVFNQSWALLTPTQQQTFRRMSVFQGSFTADAALAITHATYQDLLALVDQSFVQVAHNGRYHIHELLRHYAAEQLAAHPTEHTTTIRQHAHTYSQHLARHTTILRTAQVGAALTQINADRENIRQAWHWAVTHLDAPTITRALPALSLYYQLHGPFQEGASLFGFAIISISEAHSTHPQWQPLLADCQVQTAVFFEELGAYTAASHHAAAALQIAPSDSPTAAAAHQLLGKSAIGQGEFATAVQHLHTALALAQTHHWPASEAETMRHLSVAHISQGSYQTARTLAEEALRIERHLGNPWAESGLLNNLSVIAKNLGDLPAARHYLEENLQIAETLNDRRGKGKALTNLGSVLRQLGDDAAAMTAYQQALLLKRELGDRRGESLLLNNLGNVLRQLGDYTAAQHGFEQALQLNQQLGRRRDEAMVRSNLGLLAHLRGDNETAVLHSETAVQLAQSLNDRSTTGYALLHLGHALLELGCLPEAATAYEQSAALRQATGEQMAYMESQLGLACTLLAQQQPAAAHQLIEPHIPQIATSDIGGCEQPYRVYHTCWQILHTTQDPRASAIITQAHTRLQKQAAQLPTPAQQTAFLQLPLHQELLAISC